MTPGLIRNLIDSADRIKLSSPLAAFALYWLAFEGLRIRVLAVIARMRGHTLARADVLADALKITNLEKFKKSVSDWSGTNASIIDVMNDQVPGLWRILCETEVLRHKFFHGVRAPSRQKVDLCNELISLLLKNPPLYFSRLQILLPNRERHNLVNPMLLYPGRCINVPVRGRNIAPQPLPNCPVSSKTPKIRMTTLEMENIINQLRTVDHER